MIGSFVIRYLVKRVNEKKNKRQGTYSVGGSTPSVIPEIKSTNFDVALKNFSGRISKDLLENPFKTSSTELLVPITKNESVKVASKNERFERFKIKSKKEHRVMRLLKSSRSLKDIVVTTEVLKTKF